MRHHLARFATACAVTAILLATPGAGAFTGPPADPAEQSGNTGLPVVIKSKPTFVADVLAQSENAVARGIEERHIVRVEVVPRGNARGFAYFDSGKTWHEQFRLSRPEDFDNDGETHRWKLVGGMSLANKRAEFEPVGEGGAPLGTIGTGTIELKVWHRAGGNVTCTAVPVRVGMKKLYLEVDWLEGSFRKRVTKRGPTETLSYKPVIDRRFIDAFGQCGLEVVVCDSPETGNTKNTIAADVIFDGRRRLNCENLSSLVPRKFRDERDAKALNEGTSVISRWLIDNGYVNLDPSRPDTVYMIGVQRWARKRSAMSRTMGVVCLLEHEGKRLQMAYVFTRSIAESTAAVNAKQKTQIPFIVAARHTAIHEIAAHTFPVQWNNSRTSHDPDPYWSGWRYLYAGHAKRPAAQDDYYRIYETCVTSAETGLDGAYYAFMNAPRLNDFRWRMANCVNEKCRDIIRDNVVDGRSGRYGHLATVTTGREKTAVGSTRDTVR